MGCRHSSSRPRPQCRPMISFSYSKEHTPWLDMKNSCNVCSSNLRGPDQYGVSYEFKDSMDRVDTLSDGRGEMEMMQMLVVQSIC